MLLVACANVASLLLVRARAREGELAVRSALGGGRGRLARQMLTESLVLAGAGTVGGLLVARWTIGLISVLRPGELPRAEEIGLRGSALLFAAAITAFVALAVGLAPALRAARTRAGAVRGGAAPRRPARTRPLLGIHGGLIVAEVALSVVLVISAGLLVRSLQELRRLDPGFEAQGVVAATVSLPFFSYREEAARVRFYDAFADALRELPGVEASALSAWLPLAQEGWVGGWLKPGEPATRWAVNAVEYRSVSPGYFAAVGTPIVHGRALVSTDERPGEPPVVVVDRRFADRAWPGLDPLGERLLIAVPGESQAGEAVEVSVVGVAESARLRDLRQAGAGAVYMPMRLNPWFRASALVRTDASPAAVGAALEGALAAIDPAVPLYEVRPLTEYVDDAMAPVRFATALMMAFAGLALVLAGVGLFGVVSSAVQQRSREIGLRVALGAAPASVVGMVVRAGLGLTLVGVGLGVAASAALTGGLAFTLFGVAPTDPAAFAGAAVVIVAVAVVACLVPARRAARVDPAVTLRAD
ncbi:MAG: FtsX-like permease family protein [Gemmatimonadetes bacterium]|nr:MAG: FtsX-like permease family protein [Gemmatimonadota bacterium]